MSEFSEQAETLADELSSGSSYDFPVTLKRSFQSWHLPRKQFVRIRQWLDQITKMLDSSSYDRLTYLCLPGLDLLDIRQLHDEICAPRGIPLRFLGFNTEANPNSSAQIELQVSLDAVMKFPHTHTDSYVLHDDICRLANPKSIASRRVEEVGPFDVVNFDLCTGFGRQAPDAPEDTLYTALSRLVTIQARHSRPWLLLLTTRVGTDHIDRTLLQKLLVLYQRNLDDCSTFASLSESELGIERILGVGSPSEVALPSVYVVSLLKWIASLALALRPQTAPELKSVLCYSVSLLESEPDMYALAVKFHPRTVAPPDSTGISSSVGAILNDCAFATAALHRVCKSTDVGELLRTKSGLNADMVASSTALLSSANFDPEAYRLWLDEDGCAK